MVIRLFQGFGSYDLEKTTFPSAPLSLTLCAQLHDNYLRRQSAALAEVFGCCDSDDSPDADNGNGCVVVLYSVLYTKPRAASLALCLTWALHQVWGMGLLLLCVFVYLSLCVLPWQRRAREQ